VNLAKLGGDRSHRRIRVYRQLSHSVAVLASHTRRRLERKFAIVLDVRPHSTLELISCTTVRASCTTLVATRRTTTYACSRPAAAPCSSSYSDCAKGSGQARLGFLRARAMVAVHQMKASGRAARQLTRSLPRHTRRVVVRHQRHNCDWHQLHTSQPGTRQESRACRASTCLV
jgi:hypothetical protein